MQLNKKLLIGAVLIISNFIVGKFAITIFAMDITFGITVYLFSWLMLIVGFLLCGREGLYYARIHYYHFKQIFKKNILRSYNAIKPIKSNKEDPT